ncbi:ADP-ribosylglycohydrolase family protein [Halomonas sp. 22501_18_FS]|uniref:ADP-ribosylglycohydrolase n=1 Tax=Vreelandella halophila TaxID=86177 RepID=A0A9X4Y9V6_9GAMM|nr:hypothetical protein [Halomonas utahensis]MYL76114.1 hypothetical protein [Halomonas sp. 22501_18_FS]
MRKAVCEESDRQSLPHPFAHACYPEHGIPLILWIVRIHGGNLHESLCTSAMIGGDTVHRGMSLGMLLGAIQPVDGSLRKGLVHHESIKADIKGFVDMALSGQGHLAV